MNITKITLTAHQISGTAEGTGLVLSITPGYEFQNGKKTDIISHMKYETVFTNNGYEKMTIKVLDTKPVLTNEAISQAGGQKKVKFKNLSGRIYRTSTGEYAVSASAESAEVLA